MGKPAPITNVIDVFPVQWLYEPIVPDGPYGQLEFDGNPVEGVQITIEDGEPFGWSDVLGRVVGVKSKRMRVPVRRYLANHSITVPDDAWRADEGPGGTLYAFPVEAGKSPVSLKEDPRQAESRKNAVARRRRVIYNDDGCAVWGGGGIPEGFLKHRMHTVPDSQVDSVYFNTVMWADRFSHTPTVGEFVTESLQDGDSAEMRELCLGFQQLADAGRDAMQLTLDFCHEHDLEFVWTYRLNDIHAVFEIEQLARFKKQNPHLLLGSPRDGDAFPGSDQRRYWTALNFAYKEVRQRRLDVIADVLSRYDVDGIDLDFMRHPIFFELTMLGRSATPEELGIMNGFVRQVRKLILEVSQKRGRPMLLSVRIPETVRLAHRIGLDIERWLKYGLVDIVVSGGG